MSGDELPRAYAHAVSSSSSSSSEGELSSTSQKRRRRRRYTSSTSSSTTTSISVKRTLKQRHSRKRQRESSSSSGSSTKSRPMWPRKRKDGSPSPKSSSSSSSSDDSRHRRRHRRRSRSHRHSIWMPRRHIGSRHGQADRFCRSDRFYEPRPVSSDWTRKTYDCQCGEQYGSQKALAHHILQNHDAEIPCFGCNQTLSNLPEMLEHFQTVHKKSLVACVYCKSVFGKAGDMTENQWKRLKTHMYGELVYAKLAEMQG
ncbi:zinc finger, C2H2 type [Ancylostoma caninum]|uniref:Zinc finger, C2H2 type n=1 Tax=Ancylostoma caninum TaxID=29170 RepID=A0A368GGM7_ANCCA|nr:zinc finger, C2H2 type [Ancylostoma caninum]